jgi:hypothetical protein
MTMPLSKLPAAMGFENEITKGMFPHLFNVNANFDYEGPYPALHYYGADHMKPKERETLIQWHGVQEGKCVHFLL